jgi:hypothetical protein
MKLGPIVMFVVMGIGANAQKMNHPSFFIRPAIEFAFPPNSQYIGYSFKPGIGANIMGGKHIKSTNLYATASFSYLWFARSNDTLLFLDKGGSYITGMLGLRNYVLQNLFAEAELGLSNTSGPFETGQLQLSAALGAGYQLPVGKKGGVDISLRFFYSKYKVNNDSWLGLRVGYMIAF